MYGVCQKNPLKTKDSIVLGGIFFDTDCKSESDKH